MSPVASPALTLVVPGLFAASASAGDASGAALPALRALLARADAQAQPVTGLEARLFGLFGVAAEPGADLPVAAVTRVLDLGVIDNGWWLRADPVHLVPDRDRLILTDPRALDLTPQEAGALAAEIMEVYAGEGWLLKAPHPQRWYLRPPQAPRLATTPLSEVIGRDIHPCLPRGQDGKAWHTLLNEMQILLHTARTNSAREAQGKLPVNSLWFWGGGRLPKIATAPWARVWGAEPLARGLARLAQVPSAALPAGFGAWHQEQPQAHGAHLLILDALQHVTRRADPQARDQWLAAFERDWIEPALAALRAGALAQISVLDERGPCFVLDRRALRRWWRRRRALADYAA